MYVLMFDGAPALENAKLHRTLPTFIYFRQQVGLLRHNFDFFTGCHCSPGARFSKVSKNFL